MKKKLLITAALSLSLTSLAPVTSLAATTSQNNVRGICEKGDTLVTWKEEVHSLGQHITNNRGEKKIVEIMSKLAEAQQLGLFKGDEVKIKIDPESKIVAWREHKQVPGWSSPREFEFNNFVKIDDLWLDRDHSDPSLDISYDPDQKEVTIKKIKNMDSTGQLSWATRGCYSLQSWFWNGIQWVNLGGMWGPATTNRIEKQYWNFKKAPKLAVDPQSSIRTIKSMDIDKLDPKDFYRLISHAGNVKAEFKKKPNPNILGEQTATIRVWDEYGEETPSDQDHNKTFDVKFNVVDETTWEDGNRGGWDLIPPSKYEILKDPKQSLTGDSVLHSDGNVIAGKSFNLTKGATYKFTTFIKATHPTETDKVVLSLVPENMRSERLLFDKGLNELQEVDKEYKQLSVEFTVKDNETKPTLFFRGLTDTGAYVDSFKLEKVK